MSLQLSIADCRFVSSHAYNKATIGNRKSAIFILVFVLVFVESLFFDNIQLDRIESNYFKLGSTFFTSHNFALVCVQINVNISITVRASSGRHCFILPAIVR